MIKQNCQLVQTMYRGNIAFTDNITDKLALMHRCKFHKKRLQHTEYHTHPGFM